MKTKFLFEVTISFLVFALSSVNAEVIYYNGFEDTNDPLAEWSNSTTDVTPIGSRRFLGQFGNESITFTLNDLPSHTCITISFDLFIIRTWDGHSGPPNGPDTWDLSVISGPTLLHTTFAHWEYAEFQAFPDNYPDGDHPGCTGASEINTLGYFWSERPFDSVYNLSYSFQHTGDTIQIVFSGNLTQGISDESWGIDNVKVSKAPCESEMVLIPGGEFDMGDHYGEGNTEEEPNHPVVLNSFYIAKDEITNQQYCEFLNCSDVKVVDGRVYKSSDSSNTYLYFDTHSADSHSQITYNGSNFFVRTREGYNMSNHPVLEVSWYGAAAYCNWLSCQQGYQQCYSFSNWECDFSKNGYRLPTEAEWEYAARGGCYGPYYKYPWCDNIVDCSKANYNNCNPLGLSYPTTTPVGYYAANCYGLYDMAGNVWEWCNDWYDPDYYSLEPYPHVNPTGPSSGTGRVMRSGSCDDNALSCRVSNRGPKNPGVSPEDGGFRIARVCKPPFIEVDLDIRPTSCPNPLNIKSTGVLPVAILGTEDFDVGNIDVASILLEGVDPIRSNYDDVATPVSDGDECECTTEGPDGFMDLTLKFDTQEIVAAIGEVNSFDVLSLTLEGVLYDETPIQGEDCIIVLKARPRPRRRGR